VVADINYAVNQVRITNFLAEIARKDNASYLSVIDIHNKFNDRVYNDEIYSPELDNKALELTQRYFAIKKIRDSKK
jgi:hypothetical protein